jgi:glucan phosphorylase
MEEAAFHAGVNVDGGGLSAGLQPRENQRHFRDLTLRFYGGDSTTRIMQETLLGVGGCGCCGRWGFALGVPHE